jgi:hypothetical protein
MLDKTLGVIEALSASSIAIGRSGSNTCHYSMRQFSSQVTLCENNRELALRD